MPAAPRRNLHVAAMLAILLASTSAQGQRQPDLSLSQRQASTIVNWWPISPAVVATVITHGEPSVMPRGQLPPVPHEAPSGPVTLDLLILWRGAPGWFMRGGGPNLESGGGDNKGHVSVHVERSGLVLDVTLDTEKRVVQIAGNEVALGEANVVLVDGLDVPGGLTISGTRTVEPRIEPPPRGLFDVFRGAPDLVPFLRCDARLPALPAPKEAPAGASTAIVGYMQQVLDANCARIQGK